MKKLQVGVVGLGARGQGLIGSVLLKMEDIQIAAVCDVYPDRVKNAADSIEKAGHPRPFETENYRDLADLSLDAVLVLTSWKTHVEIVTFFMERGIAVGSEVGGARTLEDCFRLVETWERTRTPYMFLENCNYGRRELMVLRMVREGLFGKIVHCSGGYQHDLREEVAGGEENRHYRLEEYRSRNCENYPSHELGPILRILDVGENNRLLTLRSTASAAVGLEEYCRRTRPEKKELWEGGFAQGDVVTTVITCSQGQTITLTLDTTLPRYYSRGFTVRGTRGMYMEENDSIFLDGVHNSADFHWKDHWGNAESYAAEYEHPLWAEITQAERDAGHGGMDYLCLRDFFDHVRSKEPMPIDVYEGALLMCITPLSEQSVAQGGMPVKIPDFRGGND